MATGRRTKRRTTWRSTWRLLALTLTLITGGCLGAVPGLLGASPASAAAPTTVLTLVSQSASVGSGVYHVRVRIAGRAAGATKIQVTVWSRLTTRTYFDDSLGGHLRGNQIYATAPLPIEQLSPDRGGTLDIGLPVNSPSTTQGIPRFAARADSGGVYPLQVRLYDSDGIGVGAPLTTYLVYVPASTGLPKLSVALTLGVHAAVNLGAGDRPAHLTAGDSATASGLVSALGESADVPVTLNVTPQTAEALAAGGATDRATAAALGQLTAIGADQLLPATYVPINAGLLEESGLGQEVAAQLAAGSATLTTALHRRPDPAAWVAPVGPDAAELSLLNAGGVTRLVVPDHDLSPPPAGYGQSTFARPALLSERAQGTTDGSKAQGQAAVAGSRPIPVVGADDGLSAHFVTGGDQVLAANHLLAELAMIQLETPANVRGVVVVPPAGWKTNTTFVSTVLTGLKTDPLLSPVTVDGLFAAVPVARSGASDVVRSLVTSRAPTADPAATNGWRLARQQLTGFAGIVPSGGSLTVALSRQLLISQSADLSATQRQAVLSTVTGPIQRIEERITVPGPASITLTARDGNLPLTVLSDPSLAAMVQLRLTSQKLTFRPLTGPWGQCQSPAPSSLVCHLALTSRATTLQVPVETRTSGVFALVVSVLSPDGSVRLATNRDTVRSTAFSGVGVILMVVAGLSLVVWWIRNARHGRRARQLVVPPELEGDAADPLIDGLSASAPPLPELPPPVDRLSPSVGPGGPN